MHNIFFPFSNPIQVFDKSNRNKQFGCVLIVLDEKSHVVGFSITNTKSLEEAEEMLQQVNSQSSSLEMIFSGK